jgi:hypothetical protein
MKSKENYKVSYIPASDGWNLVGPIYNDIEVIDVYFEPILAWELRTVIGPDDPANLKNYPCFVIPITVEGYPEGEYVIRRPDKSIVVTGDRELKGGSKTVIAYFNELDAIKNRGRK